MEFPLGDPRQIPHQGALLCQDWPGPRLSRGQPIREEVYFAGDHVRSDASVFGLIAFFFACYGAGTPQIDDFSAQAFREARPIAPYPFTAQLPVKLLSHPRGGALAAVGHVERAWGYSFNWPGVGTATDTFDSALTLLLDGHPIGSAVEFFNNKHADLSVTIVTEKQDCAAGKVLKPLELASLWTANNDARNYVIIGDPAVRLPVAGENEAPNERP
jgi:hypothetical protein